MKIALLQRLTGHKKRAPNSRTFLGQLPRVYLGNVHAPYLLYLDAYTNKLSQIEARLKFFSKRCC